MRLDNNCKAVTAISDQRKTQNDRTGQRTADN